MGQQQHSEVTVEFTYPRWSDSSGESGSTTMIEAQFDSRPPRRGERWYQCPVCLETFPAGEVVWVHGTAYCPGDAEDILEDEWKAKNRRVEITPEDHRR
jgi:hypothetical protein